MRAARKALRGASERHAEGVPRWRGRSYLSVSVKTEKHTLALRGINQCSQNCNNTTLAFQGKCDPQNQESDSESSGSGPVDESVLGCGSVAGDSDWDSDQSDSDPSRSSRSSATGDKSAGVSQPKQLPTEPDWDIIGENTEPEMLSELFTEQDRNNNGKARNVTGVTTCVAATPGNPMASQAGTSPVKASTTVEQSSTSKKVTWQFKPAQRSVCTGSRKERDKEMTSAQFSELGEGETHRPPPLSSSSSSSSPSSSSSG
ncbi:unnamed protein product [Pleuronectes platessa]|uniref:Uncharacterized protein n=1 Tax=Pleuronectes platessa TaxID=8262 RepID=A0A9N7VPU6_PLEPL|nr:unnamed protein product [Pleuronectes platessa]